MMFANPAMLWLLFVIPPAMIAFFWWSARKRRSLLTQFIQARLLPGLTVGISTTRQKLRNAALVVAVACLIVALARPQWGFDWQEVKSRGLDIMVAIDTSKSMLAEDIAPNRLTRAKLAALDLMQQAKSDRLGVVAFAGSAFLQCPLTSDDSVFRQSVQTLDVNLIPEGGTAISEAIETASEAFQEGENHRVLVLFSDGEDQDSGALDAAKKAAEGGMKIYTIGVGSAEGELLRVKDAKGRSDYIRDEQGNVVKSHLNEDLLRQIASATEGGFYLPLRGAKTVDTLYEQGLAKLPKSERQERLVKRYFERFHWPLAIAIFLLAVEMIFPERKREPKQKTENAVLAKLRAGATAVLVVLVLMAGGAAYGSSSSALRDYKSGKYDQAQKEYERLLKRKGDDPRLQFNAGTSAYRNQQYEEALKRFEEALRAQDLGLQELAYYNRGNTFYHLGERNADQSKRAEAWKKAIQDYESTLKLNPGDADAKYNKVLVERRLAELQEQQKQKDNKPNDLQPSEAAKKAKAEADEAVGRRNYSRALEIMESQSRVDPTTSYYGDYIKRLKEVTGVQDPAAR